MSSIDTEVDFETWLAQVKAAAHRQERHGGGRGA